MPSVVRTSVIKVNAAGSTGTDDLLAAEEPLEIRLRYNDAGTAISKNISVTMRTPGNDEELAAGFLFTEGIIRNHADISGIELVKENNDNVLSVMLAPGLTPDTDKLERNFYMTSSCGVCGKASIQAVRMACSMPDTFDKIRIPARLLYELPDRLRSRQEVFDNTGGLHACALFDLDGHLLYSREDVGRHNALDKLIGAALGADALPLGNHILMLSGRISFELMQKSIMAGIKVVAAVGAPSSLAAEIAEEWGTTLVGFLRGERFNIYSGAERIII